MHHIAPFHTCCQTGFIRSIKSIDCKSRSVCSAYRSTADIREVIRMVSFLVFCRSRKPSTIYVMESSRSNGFSIRTIFVAEVGCSDIIWCVYNVTLILSAHSYVMKCSRTGQRATKDNFSATVTHNICATVCAI